MSSVFVSTTSKFAPRIGRGDRTLYLGSFDVREPNGVLREVKFKDESGNDSSELVITPGTVFRTDNPNDVHNLEALRLLVDKEPTFRELINITDPELNLKDEMEAENRSFEIASYLRSHKSNTALLSSIYRLVVGSASGLTNEEIFLALSKKANADPNSFLDKSGDAYIYESGDFETLALIENAIDLGILSRGIGDDHTISYKNGDILAENINKAVFYLKADDKARWTLEKMIDGTKDKSLRMKYVPAIEESEFVNLSSEVKVEKSVAEIKKTDADFKVEVESSVKPLTEAGFLIRTGDGPNTRYAIHTLPSNLFKKSELVDYFIKNRSQFEDIQKLSKS